jgi:hypothetical protein
MIRRMISVSIALLPLLGAGCSGSGGGGGSGQTAQEAVLYEVAGMLRGATRPDGRGPAALADLKGSQSLFPHGYQAVKSGDVVVVWGAGVKGEGEAASKGGDIVAYEKDAPANGGYVLLTSGEVKKMSASEFQSAPKAK